MFLILVNLHAWKVRFCEVAMLVLWAAYPKKFKNLIRGKPLTTLFLLIATYKRNSTDVNHLLW
jgi:hypothetical protein